MSRNRCVDAPALREIYEKLARCRAVVEDKQAAGLLQELSYIVPEPTIAESGWDSGMVGRWAEVLDPMATTSFSAIILGVSPRTSDGSIVVLSTQDKTVADISPEYVVPSARLKPVNLEPVMVDTVVDEEDARLYLTAKRDYVAAEEGTVIRTESGGILVKAHNGKWDLLMPASQRSSYELCTRNDRVMVLAGVLAYEAQELTVGAGEEVGL